MQIEVVSHCWNYSRMAMYHLSSFVLHPPQRVDVTVTIFFASQDQATQRVLDHFAGETPPRVKWSWRELPVGSLMRRAIGRNLVAQTTTADWVWYCDIDTLVGAGSLDELADRLAVAAGPLCFPRWMNLTTSEAEGDRLVQEAEGAPRVLGVSAARFQPVRYSRAIGGVQMVRAARLKEVGYCPHGKWQQPVSRWMRCFDDVAFRKQLGAGRGEAVEAPNIYRILHTKKGREEVGATL